MSGSKKKDDDEEYFAWAFFPQTEQHKRSLLQDAKQCVRWIHSIWTKLRRSDGPECLGIGYIYEHALDTGDLTYCQYVLLISLPQIQAWTEHAFKNVPDARVQRFMSRLLSCRKNFLDGLDPAQRNCKKATDVQYPSLYAFVSDMRMWYLTCSTSKNRDLPKEPRALAEWDHPRATLSEEVGTMYFAICGMALFNAYLQDYTDFHLSDVVRRQPQLLPTLAVGDGSLAQRSYVLKSPACSSSSKEAADRRQVTTTYMPVARPARPFTTGRDILATLDTAKMTFLRTCVTIA